MKPFRLLLFSLLFAFLASGGQFVLDDMPSEAVQAPRMSLDMQPVAARTTSPAIL